MRAEELELPVDSGPFEDGEAAVAGDQVMELLDEEERG